MSQTQYDMNVKDLQSNKLKVKVYYFYCIIKFKLVWCIRAMMCYVQIGDSCLILAGLLRFDIIYIYMYYNSLILNVVVKVMGYSSCIKCCIYDISILYIIIFPIIYITKFL